ncbi:uncharacterized protein LOC119421601 isoform X2 [Nematolebias whitei]|nr:uncharacterized protein LOC119408424 isoform X2 [Nematolebias whitei]XP_037544756.1 uncharacterized protein LOC119421477 isoform X2 [Nematolebias whitei]XP_037544875.1 uncharacterized protein LOC119421601 isoform X2 [Nematolebias whitei]
MVLRESKPVEFQGCQCTCVAGTVLCSHVAALLFQTAHYSQLKLPAVPPVLSCTDTEQKWHKPRTMGIKPGPVKDMVVLSAKPRERKIFEGIRSNLYKGTTSPLPLISTLRIQDVYRGLPAEEAPMITTMAVSNDVPLVDSLFGPVQEGSVLSYQLPAKVVPRTRPHQHVLSPPQLPLYNYRLEHSSCAYVCSEQQQHHMMSLETTLEMSHKIESSTREQSFCPEWHQLRKCRVTSTRFREVCHTRGDSSSENLAKRLLRPCSQTADMRRGLTLEPTAIEEYCRVREVNHYPCGFLIHPDAPWMGSSPDGIIYDPEEQQVFGLLEIKCPNVTSYVDCSYIMIRDGRQTLKRTHPYYWQIQGQMLISGCDWCDFVIYTENDMFIERVPRDMQVLQTIKQKVDHFFFYFYLSACLAN